MNFQEHKGLGVRRQSYSSRPLTGTVMEDKDHEWILPDNPTEAVSQHPKQDVSGDLSEKEQTPKTLRLLLVGKSGSGKSATGNSILGRKVLESKLSATPVTKAFRKESREWSGKELQVIDTPDILSPRAPPEAGLRDICAAITVSSPGPHAVLLVTQLGRFTEQDQQVVRRLQEVFGTGILAYTVLVFTRKEDLEGGSLDDYVRHTDNRALAHLDVMCSRRHCGFNNKAGPAEQEAQLKALMASIEGVLWENQGRCYSNKAYQFYQQVQGRHITPDPRPEGGPSEEPWMEDLRRIQQESEESNRLLLEETCWILSWIPNCSTYSSTYWST